LGSAGRLYFVKEPTHSQLTSELLGTIRSRSEERLLKGCFWKVVPKTKSPQFFAGSSFIKLNLFLFKVLFCTLFLSLLFSLFLTDLVYHEVSKKI
jgi:hypothetical protein